MTRQRVPARSRPGVFRPRPWTAKRIVGGIRKHAPSALLDALAVALAHQFAILLRYEGLVPAEQSSLLLISLPFVVVAYVLSNLWVGVYWRAWRYGGLLDALDLAKAAAIALGVVLVVDIAVGMPLHRRPMPLTIAVAGGAFSLFVMGGIKLTPRLRQRLRRTGRHERLERLLIFGAGEAGQWLVRELQSSSRHPYLPVCFVDDDPRKVHLRIHGVPVAGGRDEITALVEEQLIDVVAVAVPSAPGSVVREIVDICQRTNAKVRIVPGVGEVLGGHGSSQPLREVTVEDLLGRPPVSVDLAACSAYIAEKVVLLTGAAGSIGSELSRQVFALRPKKLVLLDTNESGLHDLQLQLSSTDPSVSVESVVCSVDRRAVLDRAFERHVPAVVFHAAAYKHVPLMEEHGDQAVLVNVVGTANVCLAARRHGTERVVLISTDKAVNPTNVMGATKRICEELIRSYRDSVASASQDEVDGGRRVLYAAVRFGNVLESRGSVIPTFKWQIARGGPVTVTHPHIRRYFMTIPEAASLVLQAGSFASGGDVFLLDMGEEMSIADLAEKMILLRGLRPKMDIEIIYTGLRPGEKLREELVVEQEMLLPTSHEKISRVAHVRAVPLEQLLAKVGELEALAEAGKLAVLREELFELVRFCESWAYGGNEEDFAMGARLPVQTAESKQSVSG